MLWWAWSHSLLVLHVFPHLKILIWLVWEGSYHKFVSDLCNGSGFILGIAICSIDKTPHGVTEILFKVVLTPLIQSYEIKFIQKVWDLQIVVNSGKRDCHRCNHMIVDLLLPVLSVPIIAEVVGLIPIHVKLCSIQHYVIKFVSDSYSVVFSTTNKTEYHNHNIIYSITSINRHHLSSQILAL
jgi:hypothetical protein